MQARVVACLRAAALLAALGGCGDTNETNVFIGVTPTPAPDGRTATPQPTRTPIASVGEPTPTATAAAATPTVVATASESVATPTTSATPAGTATPAPTVTPQGAVDADVQQIAADIVPFLAHTDLLTGGSTRARGAVGSALKTDDCPDGGVRHDDEAFPARTLTFEACDVSDALGAFRIAGQVVITLGSFGGGSIAFDCTLTDRATGHAVAFLGTLTLTVDNDGFILDGALAVSTPEGNFTLHADGVTITANRKIVSGSGSVTDDADHFGLETVAFVVTRRGAASDLTVTFDDGAVHEYTLDLETGTLTQTS